MQAGVKMRNIIDVVLETETTWLNIDKTSWKYE